MCIFAEKFCKNMELNEILSALKGIANTPAKMLTAEDKAFVAGLCDEHGVKIARKNCNSCYIDAAVELYGKLNVKSDAAEDDGRKYVLKAGTRVIYNGIHVNEATLTDELAEALVRAGMPTNIFSKLPSNED